MALRLLAERRGQGLPINQRLFDALASSTDDAGVTTLPCVDSHLFSISVTPSTLELKDAEWGEGLVYGADETIRKDVAPNDLVAVIEFSDPATAPVTLTTEILETAKRYGTETVGGGVLVVKADEKGLAYWGGRISKANRTMDAVEDLSEVLVQGSDISIRDNGELKKLVLFPLWRSSHVRSSADAWA